ncbi:GNAT family N-acetyltransferase [Psychromonas sp. PT13]|uniref:GNAT family N-acetyltransferase n=1 Tax=Psychromonas sp. PT13 TaxID=3439547 RepID=UPI003EB7B3ED
MKIEYKVNHTISALQFTELLTRTSLGERRPVGDLECMLGMLDNSNLIVTAWDGNHLVGIARSVTDFHFCCYLSDLAVDEDYQYQGIGKQLQITTQAQLGPKCFLLLLAAPAAKEYYQHIGFTHNERCWMLERSEDIN